jgi:hypothetical protein
MSTENTEETTEIKQPDFKGFWKKYSKDVFINILLYVVVFGSIGLYISKVAGSNILPTTDCLDTNDSCILPVSVDMNVVKERTSKGFGVWENPISTWCQKATFNICTGLMSEYLDPSKDKNPDKKASHIKNEMFKSLKTLDGFNNSITNKIFGMLCLMPEWISMIFFTLTGVFIFLIYYVLNFFMNIGVFLKSVMNLFTLEFESIGDRLSYCVYLFFYSMIMWTIMPIVTTVYAFILPLLQKYTLESETEPNTNNENISGGGSKTKHFGNFLMDTFKYKRVFMLIMIVFSLLSNSLTYLGPYYFLGGLVGLALLANKEVFMDTNPNNKFMIPKPLLDDDIEDIEKTTNRVSDRTTNRVTDRTTNRVTDRTTNRVTDRTTNRVSDRTTNRVSDSISRISSANQDRISPNNLEVIDNNNSNQISTLTEQPVIEQPVTEQPVTEEQPQAEIINTEKYVLGGGKGKNKSLRKKYNFRFT